MSKRAIEKAIGLLLLIFSQTVAAGWFGFQIGRAAVIQDAFPTFYVVPIVILVLILDVGTIFNAAR